MNETCLEEYFLSSECSMLTLNMQNDVSGITSDQLVHKNIFLKKLITFLFDDRYHLYKRASISFLLSFFLFNENSSSYVSSGSFPVKVKVT